MYNWSEEQPQYNIARSTYRPSGGFSNLLQAQALQTERAGERAGQQIEGMFTKPIEAYQRSAREARLERRQQAEDERVRALSDLQKKQIEQQIASEEAFGKREREARLRGVETEAAKAETARKLAELQVQQAQQESELMGKTAPSGRTFAEEKILAPIEATRQQMELAAKQMTLAEKQAAVNAETQRLAQQNARLGISETEREMRVRDLTSQIAAETDPAARQAKIDALMQQAKPQEVAAAIGAVRSNEAQAQMFQRMLLNQSPQEQALVQESLAANSQIKVQNEALSRLDSAIAEMERSPMGSDDQRFAAERAAQVFEQLGYNKEADEVRSAWSFKGSNVLKWENPFESRVKAAKETRGKIMNLMANNLESQYGHLDTALQTAQQYRQRALGMGEMAQGGNIFQMPQQTAYPPMPPVYDPLRNQQMTGQPQFVKSPDGTLKLQGAPQPTMGGAPGQPSMPGPQANAPLFNFLRQGKPVTQQAGK